MIVSRLGRRELLDGLGGKPHLVTHDVTRLALDPRHLVAELPGEAQTPDPAWHPATSTGCGTKQK
jgi:hypothetical protein